MCFEQIKKISMFMAKNNVAVQIDPRTVSIMFLGETTKALDAFCQLENWDKGMNNDPRELSGYRVSTEGLISRRVIISPAFKHDSLSDRPIYKSFVEAMSNAIHILFLFHRVPCDLEKQLELTTETKVSDQAVYLFRALRANHFRIEEKGDGFRLLSGMCVNLFDLEKIIETKNNLCINRWCYRETINVAEGSRSVLVVNPCSDQAVFDPMNTYPSMYEATMAAIEHLKLRNFKLPLPPLMDPTRLGEKSLSLKAMDHICEYNNISSYRMTTLFQFLRSGKLKLNKNGNRLELVSGVVNNPLDLIKLLTSFEQQEGDYWIQSLSSTPAVIFIKAEGQADQDAPRFEDVIVATLTLIKFVLDHGLDVKEEPSIENTAEPRLYTELEVRTLIAVARPDLNTIEGKEVINNLLQSI